MRRFFLPQFAIGMAIRLLNIDALWTTAPGTRVSQPI
jgi:hypothetical protein